MKENNNKGFTLIELLAVVVILLAISVIAITSISAALERNKNKQNEEKYKAIESVAKAYYNEHKNSLQKILNANSETEININNLDLTESEITDADGNKICGKVKLTKVTGTQNVEFHFEKSTC